MPQRKAIAALVVERRDEMVRYAGAVSGDMAGAEDLVQEAWLRCDQAARTAQVDKPAHLLWRILRNLCIDRSRRIAHEARIFARSDAGTVMLDRPDDRRSAEDHLIARHELALIQRVLTDLDPRARMAFEMHRLEGAKLHEIADRLGVSVTFAHGLVAKAMGKIRDAVREANAFGSP